MSDPNEGGAPCDYSNQDDLFANGAGGTSFSAPDFAGIAALMQQSLAVYFGESGLLLGNPAPAFYQIAKAQLALPLLVGGCNATLGNKISTACVFNDVTVGDISEPCKLGTPSCSGTSASTKGVGVLAATVGKTREYAFPAQPGYDLATGLGSVNVTNLIYNYDDGYTP
jgi:subtilase family serine protease